MYLIPFNAVNSTDRFAIKVGSIEFCQLRGGLSAIF